MIVYQDSQRQIHQLVLNEIKTNCFIVQQGKQALLVDPTDQPEQIAAYLQAHQLDLRCMLATHGHFDHVAAAGGLVALGLVERLYLHEQDLAEYKRANAYSMMLFKRKLQLAPVAAFDAALQATLQAWGLAWCHAGGHTRGSCYLQDIDRRFLITGDLLLHHKLKINLKDSREDRVQFTAFVESVINGFDADTVLFPGHGDVTSLAVESQLNPKWRHLRAQQPVCAAIEGA